MKKASRKRKSNKARDGEVTFRFSTSDRAKLAGRTVRQFGYSTFRRVGSTIYARNDAMAVLFAFQGEGEIVCTRSKTTRQDVAHTLTHSVGGTLGQN